jgi:hypothetical protein
MTVPITFDQWIERDMAHKAERIAALARSLAEELGYIALRFEREGAKAVPSSSGSGVANRTGELREQIAALWELRQAVEQKRGFDAVASEKPA